jgi:hypothetical protein
MASSTRFAVPARVNVVQWLRTRDAGLSALRRACRAAIVMPAVFAIAELRIGNPTVAIFAAFGAVAMLLFVDFGGSMRERLVAQASLMLTGVIMICIGTLASQVGWLAVATTLVVAFAVLFAGIVSSVLASATTALLVSFILPVTLPGPVSSIPHRLLAGCLPARRRSSRSPRCGPLPRASSCDGRRPRHARCSPGAWARRSTASVTASSQTGPRHSAHWPTRRRPPSRRSARPSTERPTARPGSPRRRARWFV